MFSFFFRNVKTYVRFSFFFWTDKLKKKTKQNKTKKRKEKKMCIYFNFFRKMKNNKSVVNFQFSMKTNSTHNVFLLFFVFVRCPDPLLLELNKMATIESLLDRRGERVIA